MVAHELNTPLTPMRLQLQLLMAGSFGRLQPRQEEALRVLGRSLDRVHDLVQELLDIGRMEAGALRTRARRFGLRAAVDEVAESYRETARRLHIRLAVEGPRGLDVEADRGRVVQVLHNLVSNALKFTPRGGRVAVRIEDRGPHAEVRVKDSGAGLSPDQLGALFRPFSRPLEEQLPEARGTGLGLYISRSLAEAMGGSLAASSPGPGHGSTFTFTVPKRAPLEQVRAAAEEDEIANRLREIM